MSYAGVFCRGCGDELPDPSVACLACGDDRRHFDVELSDEVGVRDYLLTYEKKKRAGERKPYEEHWRGDSLHRDSGEWRKLERVIDRDNDRYDEVITDQSGAEVLHESHEPLSQHRGHGTDRPQPGSAI